MQNSASADKNSSTARDLTPVTFIIARTLVAYGFKLIHDMPTGNNLELVDAIINVGPTSLIATSPE